MSYPIDPGAKRTARVETLEATSQGDVDLLEKVTTGFGIDLVSACEPGECRAVCIGCFPIQAVLAGLSFSHNKGSRQWPNFLTDFLARCWPSSLDHGERRYSAAQAGFASLRAISAFSAISSVRMGNMPTITASVALMFE